MHEKTQTHTHTVFVREWILCAKYWYSRYIASSHNFRHSTITVGISFTLFKRMNGGRECLHYSTIKFGFISFSLFSFTFSLFFFCFVSSFSPEMTHAKHLSLCWYAVRVTMASPATTKTAKNTSIPNYKYNNLRKMNVNILQWGNTKTCPARLIQCFMAHPHESH